ncbi:glycoside hydrolase family 30 protein [Melissococcus plutonius]|uniref:glycoside hydrolase family 30 protein n=1 Tax=Melissococcus plutonius TaxID=33970 RepID=UPI003C2DED72
MSKKRRFIAWNILGIFVIWCSVLLSITTSSFYAEESNQNKQQATVQLTLNPENQYQKISSFGASGAWWAQDVGGWIDQEGDQTKRDKIAQLLFDTKDGIGLSSYRYNLGAGSADTNNSPKITDPWRKAENFEKEPKQYDWTKDKNAQYMLNQAVNYGIKDIYLFANSPLERLTKNGSAYGSNINGSTSNLAKENYQEFADYLLDVTEHFIKQGIPVTSLSPINEPQWEWTSGQEGCHYNPKEMVDFAKFIYKEKEKRKTLQQLEISVPELGEWMNSSQNYYQAMASDTEFMQAYPTWDIHSYWSSKEAKQKFNQWLDNNHINVGLKMTEWTEMVNGKDTSMKSALTLANQIHEDLTLLDVTTWQYWIAVSCYDYHDGLIYVDLNNHNVEPAKRLWSMGNFSKFIRPGAKRFEVTVNDDQINTVGFIDEKTNQKIIICINNRSKDSTIELPEGTVAKSAYVTSENSDLKQVLNQESTKVTLSGASVTTLICN